jgi:RNA-binding protein YlmH
MLDNSTKFSITNEDADKRLDIVLVKFLPNLSRSSLKKIIELKQVKVNNFTVESSSK